MYKITTLEDRVDYLRDGVLNYPLIDDIDADLIMLAIIEPATQLYLPLYNKLLKKYQAINNDRLEFLGDAVLELIISDILYQRGIKLASELSKIRSVLVRNVSLICLMNDRNLCDTNKTIGKNCADMFEAIVGAIYLHLNQNDNINPIKIMIKWMNDIWNMNIIIDDILKHPKDENICEAIQRSYGDYIVPTRPYFGYIKDDYERLEKIYQYYKLGQIGMKEFQNHKTKLWTATITCPMALGCQFYEDKKGDIKYIANVTNGYRDLARSKAALQAIDVITNDYKLL